MVNFYRLWVIGGLVGVLFVGGLWPQFEATEVPPVRAFDAAFVPVGNPLTTMQQTQMTTITANSGAVAANHFIPDADPAGVTSVFTVTEKMVVSEITILVQIVHSNLNDLQVVLISPAGTPVNVSFSAITDEWGVGTPMISDGHQGESGIGAWQLRVVDTQATNTGLFKAWQVIITGQTEASFVYLPTISKGPNAADATPILKANTTGTPLAQEPDTPTPTPKVTLTPTPEDDEENTRDVNGGTFDDAEGRRQWNTFSLQEHDIFFTQDDSPIQLPEAVDPTSGSTAAWLGGDESEVASIDQTLTIPSDLPIVAFDTWEQSYDTTCGYDVATAPEIRTYFLNTRLSEFQNDDYLNTIGADFWGIIGEANGEGPFLFGLPLFPVEELCNSGTSVSEFRTLLDTRNYIDREINIRIQIATDSQLSSSVFIDTVEFVEADEFDDASVVLSQGVPVSDDGKIYRLLQPIPLQQDAVTASATAIPPLTLDGLPNKDPMPAVQFFVK